MLLLVILNKQEIREKDCVLIETYNQKSSIADFDFNPLIFNKCVL